MRIPTVKFRRGNVTFRISDDRQLWSQHEIAQTHWPVVGNQRCMQQRVRGYAGERESRNWLVLTERGLELVRPLKKYFVRPDPYDPAEREEQTKSKGSK